IADVVLGVRGERREHRVDLGSARPAGARQELREQARVAEAEGRVDELGEHAVAARMLASLPGLARLRVAGGILDDLVVAAHGEQRLERGAALLLVLEELEEPGHRRLLSERARRREER